MTSTARQREAERASVAFQIALSKIGADTVADAIALWEAVPPTARAGTVQAWLDQAVQLVMSRRSLSVELARAYYRLVRALITGKTVADPFHPEPQYVTLDSLRHQFASLAGPTPSGKSQATNGENVAQQATGPRENDAAHSLPDDGGDAEADRILVEEIERLKEQEEAAARAAEEELRTVLEALGPANQDKLVKDIDTSQPADEVDKLRQEAHDRAGARQAAGAERVAMNGARNTVWVHHENDRRCIGYVRVSTTGTPCGWCAMLISRGPVYRSERSAQYVDGDKYHDNCHCIAIPVYSRSQFDSGDIFKLNREYAELWPQVTRGLGGKSAVSAWRRFIRQEQAAAKRRAA